jgi:hypothetical protein
MFFHSVNSSYSSYAPLVPHDDGKDSNGNLEKRSSEADDDSPLVASEGSE